MHTSCSGDTLDTFAEEELQALLEAAGPEGNPRPPIARTVTSVPEKDGTNLHSTTQQQRRDDGEEERGWAAPENDAAAAATMETGADRGTQEGDIRHVVHFIRRHGHGDARGDPFSGP